MEQIVSQVIGQLSVVPPLLVYLIAAVWVGVESAGIGVPIELMLLFEGSLVARGRIILPVAIVCTALACLLFAGVAYIIGRRVGTQAIVRVARFVGLNQKRADHIELWMRHRGAAGVLIARETPIVRSYGSYIMGAADISVPTFVLGTFAGSLIYCGVLIYLGSVLGANYAAPLHYLDQIGAKGIAIAAVVVAIVLVLHHFWGRLTLHRMAIHFHRHHAQHTVVPAPAHTS